MKRVNSFAKAGAVLVISGFAVKLLGAVYRIPLTRMLGAAQMGRYSAVFSLFMPFFSFASAGIVPSVAHFISKYSEKGRIYTGCVARTAMKLYVMQAAVMGICFVAFGRFYSVWQDDAIFFYGSIILAPTIVFAAVENICKGLTQGRMNMMPTAAANVLESMSKAVLGLGGVYFVTEFMTGSDADAAAKAALVAVTVSGLLCCIYLICTVIKSGRKRRNDAAKHCGKNKKYSGVSADKKPEKIFSKSALLKMSFPIAVSALAMALSGFFDTAVCLPRIDTLPYSMVVQSFKGASFKNAEDMSMYLLGIYQGMVLTVFNLLPAVLSYIGSAALPLISRAVTMDNKEYLNHQTTRLFAVTAGISVPVTVYVFVSREYIIQFLFDTNAAQTVVPSKLLGILLCGSVFCCFTAIFNSVLYAFGRSDIVFRILLAAAAVKCMLNYVLCGIPQINIKAFAVSACTFHTIIFVLSVINIRKLGVQFKCGKIFFLPCLASALAIAAVVFVRDRVMQYLPLFQKLCFTSVIYALIYFLIAVITGFLLISPSENSNI